MIFFGVEGSGLFTIGLQHREFESRPELLAAVRQLAARQGARRFDKAGRLVRKGVVEAEIAFCDFRKSTVLRMKPSLFGQA